MSRFATSAAHPVAGGSSSRLRAAGGLVAATTGLAVLAACGTAQAGSTAPAATTSTPTAASAASSAGSGTAAAPASPTTGAPATAGVPATAGATAPADAIRAPLPLPSAGRVTGTVLGSVSGIVTLGFDRCLFLRTDAGQRFGLEGPLATQVRTLIIGRGVPLPQRQTSSRSVSSVRASGAASEAAAAGSVRITARGTVTTGASVCSASYQFVAASGDVVSSVTRTTP